MSIPERWIKHRPLPQDIERRLESLTPLFEKEGVLLAYLFGSLAGKGERPPRPPGDVDLAVLTKEGPAHELLETVADILGTDRLDLVDLRRASPVLRFEILRSGRPIHIADDNIRERYEIETIHLYRDTEPLRRRQRKALKELDVVVGQLNKYQDLKLDTMKQDLEKRWVMERGLEACATS